MRGAEMKKELIVLPSCYVFFMVVVQLMLFFISKKILKGGKCVHKTLHTAH